MVSLCHYVKLKHSEDSEQGQSNCDWLDLSGSPCHVSFHLSSESRFMESLRCVCRFWMTVNREERKVNEQ